MTEQSNAACRLSSAQQRVLDFLLADESGDFIDVPVRLCRDIRPLEALEARELIESKWLPVALPPGAHRVFYRAVRR